MREWIRQISDMAAHFLMELGFSESVADNIYAQLIFVVGGFLITLVFKPIRRFWKNRINRLIAWILKSMGHQIPYGDETIFNLAAEKDYLKWLANEMQTISHQWHETPIIPTPAHRKKSLGWREKWRVALFRHNPKDYIINPTLMDTELSVRGVYGKKEKIKNLAKELRKFNKIVVLGEPGSGKSVCLRQLAYDLAVREQERRGTPKTVPIYIDMGAYDGQRENKPVAVIEFIHNWLRSHSSVLESHRLHPLQFVAENIETLLRQGRVTCIFDALDEMPQNDYQERYQALKNFMRSWEAFGNRFIYSCRSLDYDPAFNVDEVIIDRFDRDRIRNFLNKHVPNVAESLYARITEDDSLFEIVNNPFLLQALAYINVVAANKNDLVELHRPLLPNTRGKLIQAFVDALLQREAEEKQNDYLTSVPGGISILKEFLAELAFVLQRRRQAGTSVQAKELREIWEKYPQWQTLMLISIRARILGKRGETPDQLADTSPSDFQLSSRLEFVHHRIQEYFAAESLAQKLDQDDSVVEYFEDIWWQETVILLVGIVENPQRILKKILSPREDTNTWITEIVTKAEGLLSKDSM